MGGRGRDETGDLRGEARGTTGGWLFLLKSGIQLLMPWVGERFDGVGMDFDEVRFLQTLFDVRPFGA